MASLYDNNDSKSFTTIRVNNNKNYSKTQSRKVINYQTATITNKGVKQSHQFVEILTDKEKRHYDYTSFIGLLILFSLVVILFSCFNNNSFIIPAIENTKVNKIVNNYDCSYYAYDWSGKLKHLTNFKQLFNWDLFNTFDWSTAPVIAKIFAGPWITLFEVIIFIGEFAFNLISNLINIIGFIVGW